MRTHYGVDRADLLFALMASQGKCLAISPDTP